MPALVDTRELEPGLTAYQITGPTWRDVQAEIDRLMDGAAEAHFRNPRRILAPDLRWQARGYVRSLTPTAEACADVRQWQRDRQAVR